MCVLADCGRGSGVEEVSRQGGSVRVSLTLQCLQRACVDATNGLVGIGRMKPAVRSTRTVGVDEAPLRVTSSQRIYLARARTRARASADANANATANANANANARPHLSAQGA